MASPSLKRVFTLGCLVCLALPLACGDDDDDSPAAGGKGGSAGSTSGSAGKGGSTSGSGGRAPTDGGAPDELPPGLSDEPSTKECGAETCESSAVAGVYHINPCCAADDACGLDTTFLAAVGAEFSEVCQPREQPGTDEGFCPEVTGLTVPVQGIPLPLEPFPGCCRPDGTCGVVVDEVRSGFPLATLNLGCVEAAPFFDGRVRRCDEPPGGAGGGGAGGAVNSGEGGNGGPAPDGNGGANP
jgi:hypothetical protein